MKGNQRTEPQREVHLSQNRFPVGRAPAQPGPGTASLAASTQPQVVEAAMGESPEVPSTEVTEAPVPGEASAPEKKTPENEPMSQ